jgi:PAS domain S-box-containing protein
MSKKIIDKEVAFKDAEVEGRPIVSKTDLKGIIIYVNTPFCKLADYSKDELIGKPHNIIRHPDMPKEVFKQLWNTIEKNQKFRGFIKNLRKDGRYYWVEAFVKAIFDENGTKIRLYFC